jgi:CTP:molybdopterin cytidylyltransferase MocA
VANAAKVAGAVLAAGAGRRMGGPKAELVVDGRRLLDRAVDNLATAGCAPILAVVPARTTGPDRGPGVQIVVNPDPGRGLRSSLALAVDAAADADALVVVLVDMPGTTWSAIGAVVRAWRPGRIAVARYADRSGHPIVMTIAMWRAALAMAGPDDGARRYLRAYSELVDEVAVEGSGADLDTPADLDGWNAGR